MVRKGFTLIELLVVMAIISILSSQMLPALSTARERGRQANCMNNLKQFSYGLEMYRQDNRYRFPFWLSNLLPVYLGSNPEILLCLTDRGAGATGHGYPAWGAAPGAGWHACDIYAAPDGTPLNKSGRHNDPARPRPASYFYMFNPDPADPGTAATVPLEADTDGDGVISWREYGLYMLGMSTARGRTPAVRCLWHKNNGLGPVLNIAAEDFNVYQSSYGDWMAD